MERSKFFYIRVTGDYAMFTAPETKAGGEAISYSVCTRQALHGIVDACYFKPVLVNVIDEVKVINQIRTHTMGSRALYSNGSPGLNYITALENVEYLVKFHFEWNLAREDMKNDRNMKKHEAIMERSLERGGRRDVFLGVRQFVGFVEKIDEIEYTNSTSFYEDQKINFGIMFHSFIYPDKPGEKLISCYTDIVMEDGIIKFPSQEECLIKNTLSNYTFKYPKEYRSVDEEYEQYMKL
ncbi:type I-C CRISPR-associated protein Cas5c [Lagierella sp.]|uniref:type I-C CRISPR-associated protein Cas5c n=1 Tax=Lagierella sp. TaxID=2849657 RepID=UPI002637B788|nr:type I-C CRISPR-associated protein Cas5c [Lagierella sp.]